MGDWVFGCDVCQEVCPYNRVTPAERWVPQVGRDLSLSEMLVLDEAGFRTRFRGTPVMRARRRGLLRNACVAAGNSGGAELVPALVLLLSDPAPLVRGHAAWALGRIGGEDAARALARTWQSKTMPRSGMRSHRPCHESLDRVSNIYPSCSTQRAARRESPMSVVVILGSGLMGTAMAWPLADNGHHVRLVGTHLDGEIIRSCLDRGYHPRLRRQLPAGCSRSTWRQLPRRWHGADLVVSGVNSLGVHWIGHTLAPLLVARRDGHRGHQGAGGDARAATCASCPTCCAMSCRPRLRDRVTLAAIGGPCIAGELAGRRQTCVVFTSRDAAALARLPGDLRRRLIITSGLRPTSSASRSVRR